MMEIDKSNLEKMIREIVLDKLSNHIQTDAKVCENGVIKIAVPNIYVDETNRMDTGGSKKDIVYTKDLFSLEESPRLGCGIMEMKQTTFNWTLHYDEIDYVIEGSLTIIINGHSVTANPGEILLIPKESAIQFSVPEYARFLYITYPADWASQA